MIVLDWTPIVLSNNTREYQSPRFAVASVITQLIVRIQRPVSSAPVAWPANATMRVEIGLYLDGTPQIYAGQTTGGVRGKPTGGELAEYRLDVSPTSGLIAQATVAEVDVKLIRTRGVIETSLLLEVL